MKKITVRVDLPQADEMFMCLVPDAAEEVRIECRGHGEWRFFITVGGEEVGLR